MTTEQTPTRRPYTGSCHCGATKFVAYLTLPHAPPSLDEVMRRSQRFYRCNCTPCHKLGIFHVRLADAPADFLMFSPVDAEESLGVYLCNAKLLSFMFCKACGGRCITFHGESEVVDVDIAQLGLDDAGLKRLGLGGSEGTVKAWRPKKGRFMEGKEGLKEGEVYGYLSVNAYALDAGQGLDLAEWTEKKWVSYLDALDDQGHQGDSYERPRLGGAY